MRKIIALALVLALVGCFFTSCDSPITVLKRADDALKNNPYTATMSVDFTCGDEALNEIFDMVNLEIPVTVDGENVSMTLKMAVKGARVDTNMTICDKILYTYADLSVENVGALEEFGDLGDIADLGNLKLPPLKTRCGITAAEAEKLCTQNFVRLPVNHTHFSGLNMQTQKGGYVITCTGISNDGLNALNGQLSELLALVGAKVEAGNVTMTASLRNNKYESITLTCDYAVTVEDREIPVSVTMSSVYSYDNIQPITPPEDVNGYKAVDYENFLG